MPTRRSTTTKRPALTVADIEAGYNHDEWCGWGYLNGRSHLQAAEIEAADAIVLEVANAQRWSADELFVWMNSKPGRWFADAPTDPRARRLVSLEGLQ